MLGAIFILKNKEETQMKKSIRTEIANLALAASLTILDLSVGSSLGEQKAEAKAQNIYPLSARIVSINETADEVTVEDSNGNLWGFAGTEDYEINDTVALIMNSKGTRNIKDDEIVSSRYSGNANDWWKAYCDSDTTIVDWNINGNELAFMTSDGIELYAEKTESIYK